MQHRTEDKIRAALDGTFTRFDPVRGGVKTVRVPKCYRPTHDIRGCFSGGVAGVKRPDRRFFSPAEDAMIIALKAEGIAAHMIGLRLGRLLGRRSAAGVNKRYRLLVQQGKCQAVVA